MEIALTIALFVIGLALIIKGGDVFVDASSWMATATGIPKLIVGATVVSIATTLPELIVSLMATVDGKVDMAVGNAVGSVVANLGLIMGIGLICLPAVIKRSAIVGRGAMMVIVTLALFFTAIDGNIGIADCVLLFALFAFYIFINVRSAKAGMDEANQNNQRPPVVRKDVIINIAKFVLGAAALVIGSRLLVDNGSTLARMMGISEKIIGLTLVAIGTSLPELVTTITAIAKRESGLSIGNIIGANTIDLTLILASCSLASGGTLVVSPSTTALDLPIALGLMLVALIPSVIKQRFYRWQGFALIAIYAGYLFVVFQ